MKDDLSSSVGAVMDLLGEALMLHHLVMRADDEIREASQV